MGNVTIEGTLTPAAGVLATGQRRTVAVTDRIRQLVKIGAVVVVAGSLDEPDPVVEPVEDRESGDAPVDLKSHRSRRSSGDG